MARRPLLSRGAYRIRLFRAWGAAFVLLTLALLIGVLGYHYFEGLEWVDAFLCASMILTGMGPTATLHSVAGKLFASVYALFSGVVFLTFASMVLGPVFHRFLHRFHLELEDDTRQ